MNIIPLKQASSPVELDLDIDLLLDTEVEKLPVKLTLVDSDDGTAESGVCIQLRFTPRRPGLHSVDVHWRGLPVTGSPFSVTALAMRASESEDGPLRQINLVDDDGLTDRLTASVLRRTSRVCNAVVRHG